MSKKNNKGTGVVADLQKNLIDFRSKIIGLGEKSAQIMDEYFTGRRNGTDMVKEASQMISQAIKIEHMNQLRVQTDRSHALRLLHFLPKDSDVRERYIEITNPEIKILLNTPRQIGE